MTETGGNGSGTEQLRQLVREVLAEALPGLARRAGQPEPAAQEPAPAPVPAPLPPTPPSSVPAADAELPVSGRLAGEPASGRLAGEPASAGGLASAGGPAAAAAAGPWTVRLSTDDELHAFVLRVLRLADNPKLRRDLAGGRIRFSLAGQPAGPAAQAAHRVDQGAVTERTVAAAARAGARLVLGPRAVLTPLARDKARALGVPIEKER
jgi:hypothetical protein